MVSFASGEGVLNSKSKPTKRAPDAGDSAAISSSFLRLVIFPVGRLRRPHPSAGNANRWAPGHKTILKIFNGMSVSYAINYTTRSNSRNLKSV